MMIRTRTAAERGQADYGWLQAKYTFSFGPYRDDQNHGFRALRVMNEDRIAPAKGFGTHPHADMEIVTYVLEGALEHKDSMGNGEVLRPGEFQRISAGSGITHSEFNPSAEHLTHLYQIWLVPDRRGIEPGYEQKRFDDEGTVNRLRLVASPDAQDDSLLIHQDVRIYLSKLDRDQELTHRLADRRHAWLQVLRGQIELNGNPLNTSDGAAISNEEMLAITATTDAEIMLFDLA